MAVQIQIRRGSASQWSSVNPLLAQGELGVELDTHLFKVGDGILNWNALPYATAVTLSSSYAQSASLADFALYANSASLADTASLAYTASYALSSSFSSTASYATDAEFALSAYYSTNAGTATNLALSAYNISVLYASQSNWSISSSYASSSTNSVSSSYALSASWAPSNFNGSASFASQSVSSSFSSTSLTASYVLASGVAGLSLSQMTTGSVTASINVSGGIFQVSYSGSTDFYISSSGNIGIGTSSPVNALDVVGNISASVITASLFYGTASISLKSISASYADSASWANNSLTASFITASNVYGTVSSASVSINSLTASYLSGSNATVNSLTASNISVNQVNGNVFGTASWAYNALTSSYIDAGNITTGTLSNSVLPSQINVTGITASFSGSFVGSVSGTSSYATTASYIDASGITTGTLSNSVLPSQINVSGVSASFTGSLIGNVEGTSSWAYNAVTSSYIDASNITTGTLSNSILPSQIDVTGITASFSGSFTGTMTGTSSYATTASYIDAGSITTGTLSNSVLPSQINITGVSASFTGSLVGSLIGTSSWSENSETASYISANNIDGIVASASSAFNAISASYLSGSTAIVETLTVTGLLNATQISGSQVYITSSQLVVTDNILTLNAFTPHLQYAGIEIYDSGSTQNLTSLLWDGQNDYFFISSSDAGYNRKIITGPDNQGDLTVGYIPLATGSSGLIDSIISQSNNTIIINGDLIASNINATLIGTSSWSDLSTTASLAQTASYVLASGVVGLNLSQIATGSVTASVNVDDGIFNVLNNNVSTLYISSSGNIGIGTDTPINTLDVVGNISASVITASLFYGTASVAISASYADNSLTASYIPASGVAGLSLSQTATGSVTASVDVNGAAFNVIDGGNSLLFVSSSGNVGIGTDTPVNALDVIGNISASVITASLFYGTASWAYNSISSSYADSSSLSDTAINLALSGYDISVTYASQSQFAISSSFASSSISSSYAFSSSYAVSSSWSDNSLTASYFDQLWLNTGSTYPITSSWSVNANSAIIAITASYAMGVGTPDSVSASFSNSSIWRFTHSLNALPVLIEAYDSNFVQIIPQNITLNDQNTATLTYPTTVSGWAVATRSGLRTLQTSNVDTASYALTASYILGGGGGGTSLSTGSTYPITSSWAVSASWAPSNGTSLITGSTYPITSSWAVSSSYAITASYYNQLWLITGSSYPITSSRTVTASYATTSSYATTASYYNQLWLITGSSYPITSSWTVSSSYAITASYYNQLWLNTGSSYPITSSWATNILSASISASSTNTTYYPLFITNTGSGNYPLFVDSVGDLSYNPSTNALSASNIYSNGIIKINQTEETFTNYTSSIANAATITLNCSAGNIFYITSSMTGNFTASLTNLNLDPSYATNATLVIFQGSTGYIPSILQIGGVTQTINWQGGSAPSGSANKRDVVSFSMLNNSGSYIVLGQLVSFG